MQDVQWWELHSTIQSTFHGSNPEQEVLNDGIDVLFHSIACMDKVGKHRDKQYFCSASPVRSSTAVREAVVYTPHDASYIYMCV